MKTRPHRQVIEWGAEEDLSIYKGGVAKITEVLLSVHEGDVG